MRRIYTVLLALTVLLAWFTLFCDQIETLDNGIVRKTTESAHSGIVDSYGIHRYGTRINASTTFLRWDDKSSPCSNERNVAALHGRCQAIHTMGSVMYGSVVILTLALVAALRDKMVPSVEIMQLKMKTIVPWFVLDAAAISLFVFLCMIVDYGRLHKATAQSENNVDESRFIRVQYGHQFNLAVATLVFMSLWMVVALLMVIPKSQASSVEQLML